MITTTRKSAGVRRRPDRISLSPRASHGIRWSRVRTARSRIASGYYDRDDVQSRLVDAVLRELRHS